MLSILFVQAVFTSDMLVFHSDIEIHPVQTLILEKWCIQLSQLYLLFHSIHSFVALQIENSDPMYMSRLAPAPLLSLDTIFTLLFWSILTQLFHSHHWLLFSDVYLLMLYSCSWQKTRNTIWLVSQYWSVYSWHRLLDCPKIYLLSCHQNSPFPLPDPVLELFWPPAPLPIALSLTHPGLRVWGIECPLLTGLNWLRGSSEGCCQHPVSWHFLPDK